jgi:type IV secretory pathway VirB3-like protein
LQLLLLLLLPLLLLLLPLLLLLLPPLLLPLRLLVQNKHLLLLYFTSIMTRTEVVESGFWNLGAFFLINASAISFLFQTPLLVATCWRRSEW